MAYFKPSRMSLDERLSRDLIDEIKQPGREAIWKEDHDDHHNPPLLKNIWEDVAKSLRFDNKDTLKNKWRTLLRQMETALSVGDDGTGFALYDAMSFVKEQLLVKIEQKSRNSIPAHPQNVSNVPILPVQQSGRASGSQALIEDSTDEDFFRSLLPIMQHIEYLQKLWMRVELEVLLQEFMKKRTHNQ